MIFLGLGLLQKSVSFVLTLLCNFVVPVVETVAYKFRVGCECVSVGSGSSSSSETPEEWSEDQNRQGRRKKRKGENGNGAAASSSSAAEVFRGGNDENNKRVKLLVDITVRQVGGRSQNGMDIKETSRYVIEDDRSGKGYVRRVSGELGMISRIINLPSSVALFVTSKLKEWAHDLDSIENSSCANCDLSRVKKSPKRRIPRSNYRKVIPFFPFNLLGFSNYTAFQLPTLTKSTGTGPDEPNNLNVSSVSANGNGKVRSKRRRHSSTETSSSDNDFSHLEISEIKRQSEGAAGGHDEVDSNSDESPETVTKPIITSSSSSAGQGVKSAAAASKVTNGKITFELEDGEVGSTNSSASDMDSRKAQAGDEVHVMSCFYKELEEAANESYVSQDDPDYKPPASSTSEESSYISGDSGSDSFLKSGTDPYASLNLSNGGGNDPKPEVKDAEINGRPEGTRTQQKSIQKQEDPVTCEDDYKTPEEEDHPSASAQ